MLSHRVNPRKVKDPITAVFVFVTKSQPSRTPISPSSPDQPHSLVHSPLNSDSLHLHRLNTPHINRHNLHSFGLNHSHTNRLLTCILTCRRSSPLSSAALRVFRTAPSLHLPKRHSITIQLGYFIIHWTAILTVAASNSCFVPDPMQFSHCG